MSGHSKWATTKRQKFAADAKRSAVFTKLAKLVSIAARNGSDPTMNFSLRMAVEKAKSANMPKDNIERAIKKGAGELGGATLEELLYEGIGPAQSQFVLKCLTDNKNRTASEIRHLFSKNGGNLSAVLWNFSKKGVITINISEIQKITSSHEELELELIDNGADDIIKSEDGWIIYTTIENLQKTKQALEKNNIATESAEIEYIANQEANPSEEDKARIEKFIEEIENNEDVADYYSNVNL